MLSLQVAGGRMEYPGCGVSSPPVPGRQNIFTIRPCRNAPEWHDAFHSKPPRASRVLHSPNEKRIFLNWHLSFLSKVYAWVPKVTSSLSKTLLTAQGMRPGGV